MAKLALAALAMGFLLVQGAIEGAFHLLDGTIYGLSQGRCVVGDGCRLEAWKMGFHDAAFVILAALVTLLVAQMDIHPREPLTKPAEGVFDFAPNVGRKLLSPVDVVVGVDQNLHLTIKRRIARFVNPPSTQNVVKTNA